MDTQEAGPEIKERLTFIGCYDRIEKVVDRKCKDWKLDVNLSISKEDVKQIILIHINNKFEQHFDQEKCLEAWITTIANNQFINLLRNNYLSTARPCQACPMYLGQERCKTFKVVSSECRLVKDWEKVKQFRHNVRIPTRIEDHLNEAHNLQDSYLDIEKAANILHTKIKPLLTASEWQIYEKLYIEGLSEEDTASKLGFKSTESRNKAGYGRLNQVKTKAIKIAKEILAQDGVETL